MLKDGSKYVFDRDSDKFWNYICDTKFSFELIILIVIYFNVFTIK
jgi:hypothetical protein